MAPLLSRKLDLLYLVFFTIHIPIVLAVDMYPLYPESFRPDWMVNIRTYYIVTYQDQFFIQPPAWFKAYIWMEALYHLPISVWAIGAILRDDRKLPLQFLLFATQTALTTGTCIADFLSWVGMSSTQKVQLSYLYVPYFIFALIMGIDMFMRLNTVLGLNTPKISPARKQL